MNTVPASIPVLRWAAGRARLSEYGLSKRFRKWPQWLSGEAQPTLRQLETFARITHTPIGYFFLPEAPDLRLPVPDFRTVRDALLLEPSSELLDTLYLCQQRQDWFREYAQLHGFPRPEFVGRANLKTSSETIAEDIRSTLSLSTTERRSLSTWTEALRQIIARAEDAGVLVMASSIVGSNTHRKLEVDEFRGFALSDDFAPLIFLNASDSKSAQMFTLAHELAHLWLGQSGVSDVEVGRVPDQATERWCNRVAAEMLMPLKDVIDAYETDEPVSQAIRRLARNFKVSTLVALRRLHDAGFMDAATLWRYYREEIERLRQLERSGSGGDFYRTLGSRTGKRFARAVVSSTMEGQTLFQDAFRMLGVRKTSTFYQAGRELGILL